MHYELMSHADESWWDVASQTGNNILVGVRDFAWATYTVVAEVVTTIVYHMFNVDLLEMLMPNLTNFASSTAGQIVNNILIFGMALFGITITIRGFLKQDWGAFFKLLFLMLISLTLLFSIQSERFNYIALVDGISKDIENTLIATPPSLITGEEINYGTTDTAINMENRIYNSLLLQPYLDLNYGDTSISRINDDREEEYHVYDYLNASPFTEEGRDTRANISEYEFEDMENNNVNSANASAQIGKIVMFFISLLVQGFIYIVLTAVRYMLQIAMIIALVMLPVVIFLSFFPSFEKILLSYTRKVFQLILYKAILVFYMIFVMSIMQITYTIQNYGMLQAIVFQVVLAISVIMIYFYRNSALDTVNDSNSVSPSEASGQGFGSSMGNLGNKMKPQMQGQGAKSGKDQRSKSDSSKNFKESENRNTQSRFSQNSDQNTKRNENQNVNSQDNQTQNQRDNVTQFSDYKDKKQHEEQQRNQKNQNEQSQYKQNEQSDTRRSDRTGTEDTNANHNETQSRQQHDSRQQSDSRQQHDSRQQSDSRQTENTSYQSQQQNKQQQYDRQQSDSRQTENTSYQSQQKTTDKHTNEERNQSTNKTSPARHSGNTNFVKNQKPVSKERSVQTDKNNVTNNQQKSARNNGSSVLRNSQSQQARERRNNNQKPKNRNRNSAIQNKGGNYSRNNPNSNNQMNNKNQSKTKKISPQRQKQTLKSQQRHNENYEPKKNQKAHSKQQRANRNIKSRTDNNIKEMRNRIKPVKQRPQPKPQRKTERHQKVDVKSYKKE